MDTTSTILMFIAEAVFFTALLVIFLKLAARNYSGRIKRLAEEVNRAKLMARSGPNDPEQHQRTHQNNLKIQEQLRNRIHLLQERVKHLEGSGGQDKGPRANTRGNDARRAHKIVAGTTADRDSGVDPSYLAMLNRKQSANEAADSAQRSSDEVKTLNEKLSQQRSIIRQLEGDIQRAEFSAEVSDIKAAQKDSTIESLRALEKSLLESQTNADQLESAFAQVQKELNQTRTRLALSESALISGGQEGDPGKRSGIGLTVISRGSRGEGEAEALDNPLAEEAVRNYERLKGEVERLRQNTQVQRKLILALEQQILELKLDVNNSDLTQEQRDEKAAEIEKLQRLLRETEGCVEVLESEVSYLQDKIEVLAKPTATLVEEQKKSLSSDDQLKLVSQQLKKTNVTLKRAVAMRSGLITTLTLQNPSLEALAGNLLKALEPLEVDAHLSILVQDNEIDVANCKGIRPPQVQQLHEAILRKISEPLAVDGGFILVYKRLGVLARGSLSEPAGAGRLQDAIRFALMVGDSIVSIIEERRMGAARHSAAQSLVSGVKTNINQISVQSRYQRSEAQRIMQSFTEELSEMLKTINATDTQRLLFNELMEETKQRMALLSESEVVLDQSFERLLKSLEKPSKQR